MTIGDLLRQAVKTLQEQDNQDAYFEAETLLSHTLGISKVQLYTQSEQSLKHGEIESFVKLIARRLHHEPLAYITGHQEFCGIDFYVDRRVLIPRPETELLVEEALKFVQNCIGQKFSPIIADIGTGCGCIAISLALNLPNTKIYATDISEEALCVARVNCQRHKVNEQVILRHGDLLEPIPEPVHLIVANLPYVNTSQIDKLIPEVRDFEPRLALDGGQDGLAKIRRLLEQVNKGLYSGGCLLLEVGQEQGTMVASLASTRFPKAKVELFPDLNNIDRVIKVTF